MSTGDVLLHSFSRFSFVPFSLVDREETFSIVVLESIDSICTEVPFTTRREADASQHRLSGLLHGYRYYRLATLCFQHDPRAQI